MIFPQPPLQESPIAGSLPWVQWFSSVQKYFRIQSIQVPTLAANWSNYGGAYQTAGYWKDSATGVVHLTGLVKKSVAGVAGEAIFTLPTGYRPAAQEIFATDSNGAHSRIDVNASGGVLFQTGTATAWVSLSGISFKSV